VNDADDDELKRINQKLSASGQFLKSLYENMLEGLITAVEFSFLKSHYETEIEALSKRADDIRKRRRDLAKERDELRALSRAVSEALESRELTADIIDRLVDRIEVRRDKSFEIHFRFCDDFKGVESVV